MKKYKNSLKYILIFLSGVLISFISAIPFLAVRGACDCVYNDVQDYLLFRWEPLLGGFIAVYVYTLLKKKGFSTIKAYLLSVAPGIILVALTGALNILLNF